MPSVKEVKENAKGIINEDLISHVGAIFFISICPQALLFSGVTLSSFVISFAGEMVAYLLTFVFIVFTVAMTVPLFYGYACFEANCVRYGKADFSDMFRAFTSINLYLRSFSFMYAVLWRFLLVFAVPILAFNEFFVYTSGESTFLQTDVGGFDLTYTAFVILIVVSILISVIIYSRFMMGIYISCIREDDSVSFCFFAAKIYLKKCSHNLLNLALSFLPLLILSVASFGLMLIYTIPFMQVSLFSFAKERYSNQSLNSFTASSIFANNINTVNN